MLIPATAVTLLALADQRLPTGGHVHSAGIEQAVAEGLVTDPETLGRHLERRLATAGLVAAALAAAAAGCTGPGELARLDAEADARIPSPAQREASRAQGRGLLRLVRATWPDAADEAVPWAALGPRPHHPLALGRAASRAGLDPASAALLTAYLAVSGPATAAQRLLALDPVAVAAVTVGLGRVIAEVAGRAAAAASGPPEALPDDADPLLDLLAERHAGRGDRLFAS